MAPPVIQDCRSGEWVSQLTAVLLCLGEYHGLMPDQREQRAATIKLICDANDVLNDIT